MIEPVSSQSIRHVSAFGRVQTRPARPVFSGGADIITFRGQNAQADQPKQGLPEKIGLKLIGIYRSENNFFGRFIHKTLYPAINLTCLYAEPQKVIAQHNEKIKKYNDSLPARNARRERFNRILEFVPFGLLDFLKVRLLESKELYSGEPWEAQDSCSAYTAEAIRQHGFIQGVQLGLERIQSCHPHTLEQLLDGNTETFDRYKTP